MHNKSETIGELLKALSKAQGEMPNPKKDNEANTVKFTYKYSDLASCIQAAKQHLANNGLSIIQLVGSVDGVTSIETILGHSSGEYISIVADVPLARLEGQIGTNPAQVMGASITYMRRYQFAAIVGMAQEDDDAASAAKGKVINNRGRMNQGTQQQRPQQQPDNKPWLNKDELDPMMPGILDKLMAGERTPQQIVDNLSKKYKLNKQVRDSLLALKAPEGQ